MSKKKAKKEEPSASFEERFDQLQESLQRLERGELSLEESLAEYERGRALLQSCQSTLHEAERRIEKLTRGPDGKPTTEPFEHEAWGGES